MRPRSVWARAEDPQEVPAGRLHEPADLLLPGRPVDGQLRGVRVPRPDRRRGPRPVLAIFGRELVDVCVKFHAARGRRARLA